MRRILQHTIWAHGAVPPEEFKYRNLKRVWLPIYDLIAVFAGVNAVVFGSSLLNSFFSPGWVDILGATFTIIALVCLAGVVFPSLWAVEMVGKIVLVALIAGYIATIVFFSTAPQPSLFVAGMLAFGLPLAMFRLNMLGEEVKQRRSRRRVVVAA